MEEFTLYHQNLLDGLVPDVQYVWYYNEFDEIAVVADTNTETLDFMFFSWSSFSWKHSFSVSLADSSCAIQIVKLISIHKVDKSDLPF